MFHQTIIDCIAIGRVSRQTIVPLTHRVHERILAGPALYASAGIKSSMDNVGVICSIGKNEAEELNTLLEKYRVDSTAITQENQPVIDQFLGYLSAFAPPGENPIPYFSAMQMSLPASILSINFQKKGVRDQAPYYPATLSAIYLNASAAHICAAEFEHQTKASTLLDKTAISVLTLLSDPDYMNPSHWEGVMNLMNGLTAFITTSAEIDSLFNNRSTDIIEIGSILHDRGCQYLVLHKNAEGFELLDLNQKKKYLIPVYPSNIVDPTGMKEAFCGGLLAELRRSHDPVQAVVRGSVISSLKGEGCGPFFPLEAMPGLIEARISHIRDWVKSN